MWALFLADASSSFSSSLFSPSNFSSRLSRLGPRTLSRDGRGMTDTEELGSGELCALGWIGTIARATQNPSVSEGEQCRGRRS